MKSQIKVTIIINCFNGASFINDCVSSVIAQSYSNWELVFWDNLSTDCSEKNLKINVLNIIRLLNTPICQKHEI